MYRIAAEVLKETQLPFEALLPLIDQTAAKVHSMRPMDAQTGPAKRGDKDVISRHLETLKTISSSEFSPSSLQLLYQKMAELIMQKNC